MGKLSGGIVLLIALFSYVSAGESGSHIETLWIEAEHLDGIKGFCWPMARGASERQKQMRTTSGHWGLSGPGWAAEWNQGGESGFLSIACGAEDDQAVASKKVEIPEDGEYWLWVRYRDNRETSERFIVELKQEGRPTWQAVFGEQPVIEENNEMKLYFDGAFGWDSRPVRLAKGAATLILRSAFAEPDCRQIDCFVLTTDADYAPTIKQRPHNYAWQVLDGFRHGIPDDIKPLARRTGDFSVPRAWQPRLFGETFRYFWNVDLTETVVEKDPATGKESKVTRPRGWLRGDPQDILYPWHSHGKVADALRETYGGRRDMPIFSDPRIVPTLHGVGPLGLARTGAPDIEQQALTLFIQWLQADPGRRFAGMMNYAPNRPLPEAVREAYFQGLSERYLGSIAGENLGYFEVDHKALAEAANGSRRAYAEAMSQTMLTANRAKYQAVFGTDLDKIGNPYAQVIPAQSLGGMSFYALCYDWGAETVAYESTAATAAMLGMRTAFLRGAARQFGRRTGVYRSCNFGDASTIFNGDTHYYSRPENIFDNYYSVYSGAGMTWYKLDIWYQYMAGAAFFYHEQGFDEFWLPGGTTAAGQWPLQLSPKGKLVEHFLRATAADQNFDRGASFTPVAFLLDYAHGWDPSHFKPRRWGTYGTPGAATHYDRHEDALKALFWTAYHPIGPVSENPISGVNETYVHGVFGDIFDVIYAFPDARKWTTIDTYAVVVVGGDIELSAEEGARLAKYVRDGGTLLVAAEQLRGPGLVAVNLPATEPMRESVNFKWNGDLRPSQRYRYLAPKGGTPLATTEEGDVICASYDIGKGRLVYLGIPYGLGIDRQATPLLALLLAALTCGLLPIEVRGDVEWSLNRNATGWMLTLINAAGQDKPQQGILPTDYRQNRTVEVVFRIPARQAVDRLARHQSWKVEGNRFRCVVPAGSVRILEIQ